MLDLNNIVQGLSKSGAVSGFAGGLAGTALAGSLAGKKGRKVAKGALKVGALAAVGGLAYTAYQRYQQNNHQSARAEAGSPWTRIEQERLGAAAEGPVNSYSGLLLVRAMISAANADGHMDAEEQQRIFAETDRLDLTAAEKVQLFDELRRPFSLAEIVALVDSPEMAIEVYAASLIAIDETRPEGRAYLRELATELELPDSLVASLHTQAELARRDQAA